MRRYPLVMAKMEVSTCSTVRIGPAKSTHKVVNVSENTTPESNVVLICRCSVSYSFAPYCIPIRMLAPMQSPFKNKIIRVVIGLQIPTAASAPFPTKCPTIILSTAL